MTDWRVRATIIGSIFWLAFGWASAWKEHQCETAQYQWNRSNPPILTPCVCGPKGAEQTQDAKREAPECDWPEVDVQWATFWAIAFTLCAIIWQARETKRSADAAAKSIELTRQSMRLARHNTAIALATKRNTDKQLRLAFTPVLEIRPMFLGLYADGNEQRTYKLTMTLLNVGTVAARVLRIDYDYVIGEQLEFSVATLESFTCGAGRERTFDVEIELTRPFWEAIENRGLMIRVDVMLNIDHPIDGPYWQTYDLTIHQVGTRPTLRESRDFRGYKKQDDQKN